MNSQSFARKLHRKERNDDFRMRPASRLNSKEHDGYVARSKKTEFRGSVKSSVVPKVETMGFLKDATPHFEKLGRKQWESPEYNYLGVNQEFHFCQSSRRKCEGFG